MDNFFLHMNLISSVSSTCGDIYEMCTSTDFAKVWAINMDWTLDRVSWHEEEEFGRVDSLNKIKHIKIL